MLRVLKLRVLEMDCDSLLACKDKMIPLDVQDVGHVSVALILHDSKKHRFAHLMNHPLF